MSHLLIPNIPFSSSLVFRRETRPDQPECRVHLGFTPAWFRQHMALDYGQCWHTDPVYRCQTLAEMARVLNCQFPTLRLGGNPDETVGAISQIQTCAFMGALFGLDIHYFEDNWPANHGRVLTDEEVAGIEPPGFRHSPVFEDLMRQMDFIEREWGRIEGDLNFQGVLNTAFRLRGGAIFEDMLIAPARVHRLLGVVCDTMMNVIDTVYERQARSGVVRDFFVTANCVVNMISGAQYREFIYPYDRKLSAHFAHFGIHNCAWRVDPYVEHYATVRELDYLDFGLTSDFALLKTTFPNTTLAAMYSPVELVSKDLSRIRADLSRLRDEIGRCRIILADIEAGTAPERVMDFVRIASEIWRVPLDEMAAKVWN